MSSVSSARKFCQKCSICTAPILVLNRGYSYNLQSYVQQYFKSLHALPAPLLVKAYVDTVEIIEQ
mgnify:FL=1